MLLVTNFQNYEVDLREGLQPIISLNEKGKVKRIAKIE